MINFNQVLNKYLLLSTVLLLVINNAFSALPVAVFHGIGDACDFPGTTDFVEYLKEKLNTEVVCFEQGNGFFTSWFKKFHSQAEMACESVKKHPSFQGDFSVLGISQGNLLARYVIQKCDLKGSVKNFVSIDGPHMGIGGIPRLTCGWLCDKINNVAGQLMYTAAFQEHLAPAGYYKDRTQLEVYRNYSTFLADLNNEKDGNDEYKTRFSSLEKVVLIMNEKDTVVTPPSSAWFEFYDQDTNKVLPLKESKFYKEDYIGLRALDEAGKIKFVKLSGDHINFSDYDIDTYMIPVLG